MGDSLLSRHSTEKPQWHPRVREGSHDIIDVWAHLINNLSEGVVQICAVVFASVMKYKGALFAISSLQECWLSHAGKVSEEPNNGR